LPALFIGQRAQLFPLGFFLADGWRESIEEAMWMTRIEPIENKRAIIWRWTSWFD